MHGFKQICFILGDVDYTPRFYMFLTAFYLGLKILFLVSCFVFSGDFFTSAYLLAF